MNKLHKIFYPSPEEEIAFYERIIELHNEQIGRCSTCVHYIHTDPRLPGFVTDYGGCKLDKDIFTAKVCSIDDMECDGYIRNIEFIETIEQRIERLKGRE